MRAGPSENPERKRLNKPVSRGKSKWITNAELVFGTMNKPSQIERACILIKPFIIA
jgi:hypothetical protein